MFSLGKFSGPIEVLVTDGHTRPGLAVARSLARHGVSLLLLGAERCSPAFYSRYVKHTLLGPSPVTAPEAFVEFALEAARKYEVQLAIPVTDHAVLLFDRHRECFEKYTRLAMANSESLRNVLDKRRNLDVARRVGIPCPKQFELTDPRQIPEMIAALGFPIVLKRPGDPLDPHVPHFDFRVLYANSEAELRSYLDQHCGHGGYPLFQERAVGEVHDLCCFAAQGELLAIHQYHSIRRREGAGVLRKIVEPMPELVGHTRNLLRALRWDGLAHVGFFVSKEQKKIWYMETNGRFWASVQGSVNAGWDFPAWTYDYFRHGKRPSPGPLEIGSLTRWHLGDLMALFSYWGGGEEPETGTDPGKFGAALQYLQGFDPAIHSDIFSWSDPLPAVMELAQWGNRGWKWARKRVSGG